VPGAGRSGKVCSEDRLTEFYQDGLEGCIIAPVPVTAPVSTSHQGEIGSHLNIKGHRSVNLYQLPGVLKLRSIIIMVNSWEKKEL
jgi:hypothetical protein